MAQKQISIKTVDGNRFDFVYDGNNQPYLVDHDWLVLKLDSTTRRFLISNIVCITEREIEDG